MWCLVRGKHVRRGVKAVPAQPPHPHPIALGGARRLPYENAAHSAVLVPTETKEIYYRFGASQTRNRCLRLGLGTINLSQSVSAIASPCSCSYNNILCFSVQEREFWWLGGSVLETVGCMEGERGFFSEL